MDTTLLLRKLRAIVASSGDGSGLASIPHLGMVSSVTNHRLHAVSLPRSAAVFVLSGRKTASPGGERAEFMAGEAMLVPARMEALVENTPDARSGWYVALCVTFTEEELARTVDAGARTASPGASPLEALRMPCDEAVGASLAHLLDMVRASPANGRLLSLCREALLQLAAERCAGVPLLWTAAGTWGSRCSSLVGMEPGREWTAASVASGLATSERSLRRHLEAEGTSLRRILRDVRLSTGLAILQGGDSSVGEAARRCGYNSASRFAGLFRERFGVSPSEVLQYNAVLGPDLAGT